MNLLETAEAIGVNGFLHPDELEKLAELAINRRVLEVGAFMGLSAWGMAITARSVVSVDTFRANSAGQRQMEQLTTLDDYMRAVSRFGNVRWHVGTSEDAARAIDETFDLIFIDAMHTREDVLADIDRWQPKLALGGIMAFHDYGHGDFPGVKQAVDERFGVLSNRVITLGWL